MRSKLNLIFAMALVLLIPLISALSFNEALDSIQNNDWVKFGLIFILLFIAIFSFFNNKMDNKFAPTVIGLGVSLILTIPIMQRGILDNLLNESIVDWILIIALLIGVFFILSWLYKKLNWKGLIIGLFILTAITLFIDLNEILPDSVLYSPVGEFLEALKGFSNIIFIGLAGLGIIWLIFKIKGQSRDGVRQNYQVREFSERAAKASLRDLDKYEQARINKRIAKQNARAEKRARKEAKKIAAERERMIGRNRFYAEQQNKENLRRWG